jgi:hypothetical protein
MNDIVGAQYAVPPQIGEIVTGKEKSINQKQMSV